MKMRNVEYYRLWDDHTWDTDFIDIPLDTPEDKLEEAVREYATKIGWGGEMPCVVGLYNSQDDEVDIDTD